MADKCHLFLPPTLSHFWGPIQTAPGFVRPGREWHTGFMPKRTSTKKPAGRPSDVDQVAAFMVRQTTEERAIENQSATPKPQVSKAISRVMAQMGSKGGKIGGKQRLVNMSPERRSEVASQAAKARWAKEKGQA
jgi:hypothetical protein